MSTPASTVEICLPDIVAGFVPGAIAGDVLRPGDTSYIVILGLVSAATVEFVRVDEPDLKKHLRFLFQTTPLVGLGAGYGLARLGGLDPMRAAIPGILGALLAAFAYDRSASTPVRSVPTADVRAWPAVPLSGGPPPAPGAVNDVL